jgi:hypothetical protein
VGFVLSGKCTMWSWLSSSKMKAEEDFPMKNFKVYIEVLQALLLRFLYPDHVRHFAAMIWWSWFPLLLCAKMFTCRLWRHWTSYIVSWRWLFQLSPFGPNPSCQENWNLAKRQVPKQRSRLICVCTNWKVMQLNVLQNLSDPCTCLFCKFLHIFVFRFFLWRCSLPWTSLSNVCTGFLNLCVPGLSLKMLATVIFSLCIFLSFFYLCHLKCPV